jgi:uncharacterized protein YpbB
MEKINEYIFWMQALSNMQAMKQYHLQVIQQKPKDIDAMQTINKIEHDLPIVKKLANELHEHIKAAKEQELGIKFKFL